MDAGWWQGGGLVVWVRVLCHTSQLGTRPTQLDSAQFTAGEMESLLKTQGELKQRQAALQSVVDQLKQVGVGAGWGFLGLSSQCQAGHHLWTIFKHLKHD